MTRIQVLILTPLLAEESCFEDEPDSTTSHIPHLNILLDALLKIFMFFSLTIL